MAPRAHAARASLAGLVAVLSLAACNAIIGTRDLTYDPSARDGGKDAAVVVVPPDAEEDASPPIDADVDTSTGDGACSADMRTDKKNCGRCGHDCLGGECLAGVCKPVALATGQGKPLGITLLKGMIYWTLSGTDEVWRARTDGTDASLFTSAATFRQPWGITNDGTSVYFAAAYVGQGGIFKCAATGCPGGALQQLSSKASYDVAVQSGLVYFTSRIDGTLSRVDTNGLGETPLATLDAPFHLAVDPSFAYLTSNEYQIMRVVLTGGTPVGFGDNRGDLAGGIFVDDARVYWTYSYYTQPGGVFAKNKTTGAVTVYANTARNPLAIVADRTHVYWITLGTSETESARNDGKLLACPIAGCDASGPILLADGLLNGSALTQDETAVYFTEIGVVSGSGKVSRVAKP